jgi:hypothetical protein
MFFFLGLWVSFRVWLYWKIGYKENCVEVKKHDLQFFFFNGLKF